MVAKCNQSGLESEAADAMQARNDNFGAKRREPVLILAGSMEQARQFARNLDLAPMDWRYVTPQATRGFMHPTVYLVGTYYERADFGRAMDALIPSQPTFLNERGERTEP